MLLGVPKLDRVMGEVREGDVFLIETVGSLGVELLSEVILNNREKRNVSIILPKGASEKRVLPAEGTEVMVLGEDVHAERLYEILHHIRELPEGSVLVAIRLDVLFLLRPREAVFMFMEDPVSTVQKKKIILIMTVDKRNVDERDMAVFENLATHILDITEIVKGFKVTLVMRVKKSPKGSTGFCEFEIEGGRVSINGPPNAL
ncbi:hypothetical protein A3L14_09760 [Thermococcus thioreducens]|uniref:KaiC-like domain-containing protein n=1 Tax=Thermococcus thioreducens TaxID=277988 RepID=A0A2Z2MUN0_9EURY|nr:hypothetical protein [Thermococcus thioreducens]ASJ13154.1 hypothetical protein A3L14_09760 [Thermococcus thioreducens]